jgi:hypothetical protein
MIFDVKCGVYVLYNLMLKIWRLHNVNSETANIYHMIVLKNQSFKTQRNDAYSTRGNSMLY